MEKEQLRNYLSHSPFLAKQLEIVDFVVTRVDKTIASRSFLLARVTSTSSSFPVNRFDV